MLIYTFVSSRSWIACNLHTEPYLIWINSSDSFFQLSDEMPEQTLGRVHFGGLGEPPVGNCGVCSCGLSYLQLGHFRWLKGRRIHMCLKVEAPIYRMAPANHFMFNLWHLHQEWATHFPPRGRKCATGVGIANNSFCRGDISGLVSA